MSIMNSRIAVYQELLTKAEHERDLDDDGEGSEQYPHQWAVLVDKGYQGAANQIRAIVPTKRPINGTLTAEQTRRNDGLSTERVVVENFYGRLKAHWKMLREVFRWDLFCFDAVATICFALTNYHILRHPLRSSDTVFYLWDVAQQQQHARKAQEEQAKKRASSKVRNQRRLTRPRRGSIMDTSPMSDSE